MVEEDNISVMKVLCTEQHEKDSPDSENPLGCSKIESQLTTDDGEGLEQFAAQEEDVAEHIGEAAIPGHDEHEGEHAANQSDNPNFQPAAARREKQPPGSDPETGEAEDDFGSAKDGSDDPDDYVLRIILLSMAP